MIDSALRNKVETFVFDYATKVGSFVYATMGYRLTALAGDTYKLRNEDARRALGYRSPASNSDILTGIRDHCTPPSPRASG